MPGTNTFGKTRRVQPVQCLARLQRDQKSAILAACGPQLLLAADAPVSRWQANNNVSQTTNGHGDDDDERPSKKQKTGPLPDKTPAIIKLATSPNNNYVVVLTEDKCLRVLTIKNDGQLEEISARMMPKRPCAIRVLPDNATILVGDKFGDVYSLPLVPSTSNEQEDEIEAATSTFKPSATTSTVHSVRNRKVLHMQQQQKNFTVRKEGPRFEHKLLLGHVSMLTDMVYAQRDVDGRTRSYIITADRDEHIRVSRGPPQAHIIEGYCLGHTEYISKLCLVPGTDLLVSGGGDEWLGIWDWPNFKLLRKLSLKSALDNAESRLEGTEQNDLGLHIAVSGIWVLPLLMTGDVTGVTMALVVACEKHSSIYVIPTKSLLDPNKELSALKTGAAPLIGVEVLDSDTATLVLSADERKHSDERIGCYRIEMYGDASMGLKPFKPEQYPWIKTLEGSREEECVRADDDHGKAEQEYNKTLDDLLYGVGNLRKRTGGGGVDEE